MKKIFILSLITIVFIGDLVSQAPNLMSYQAVIWDASGNLVSEKTVSIKISILQGSVSGTSVYSETHKIQTNINGLVSLTIGGGTNATGKIADINWGGGSYFLKTETDPTGGSNYIITGTTQLVSVPYALHSNTSNNLVTPKPGLPGQILTVDKDGKPIWVSTLPTVNSTNSSNITPNTAASGGNVISDGGSPVTARGVVWSTFPNPTVSLSTITNNGSGLGIFSSTISGLILNTTYYVRAYATNNVGTGYGNEISFTTKADSTSVMGIPCPGTPTVKDIDGNTYNTVQIGTQCWTKENLKVTKYNDGTTIPLDTSGGLGGNGTGQTWGSRSAGARTIYANDNTNLATYGYLYNWYAVKGIVTEGSTSYKNLCPSGWHIPSDAEWTSLTTYLGREAVAGGKMKSSGTAYWTSPNTAATNESGFSALPGGYRNSDGSFYLIRNYAVFWSATEFDNNLAWHRDLYYNNGYVYRIINNNKSIGASIRCLKDSINTNPLQKPILTTNTLTSITQTGVTTGGNITSDGGSAITARGVVWSTSPAPTISLSTKTSNGTGIGSFTSLLTNLTPKTTYYVRAYATNSAGTGYGNEISFTTKADSTSVMGIPCTGSPTVKDIDGNTYNTVQIGTQCWTKENLKVTKYNDGTTIPLDTSGGIGGNGTGQTWGSRSAGARTIYANDNTNLATYGYLYNWYAVKGISNSGSSSYKNICPTGWHVPSDKEWETLTNYLGGNQVAGGKMKTSGTTFWISPNVGADNSSGFNAMPGGYRYGGGTFIVKQVYAIFWSATETDDSTALKRSLSYENKGVETRQGYGTKSVGASIRCLNDSLNINSSQKPILTTNPLMSINNSGALTGGNITSDDGSLILSRGVVWSTTPNPMVSLTTKTSDGTGKGSFTSSLTNLTPKTTYYVRAYANNSSGTGYGNELSFTTSDSAHVIGLPCSGTPTVMDIDGNIYNTVQIANQCWTKENLKVTKYNDGTTIPLDTSGGQAGNGASQIWSLMNIGARTIHTHSQTNLLTYGYLYNYYAAKGISTTGNMSNKNLCPLGWHVPLDKDWETLTTFLGGESVAGGKLKSIGTTYWKNSNIVATDESGFAAIPGGFRDYLGSFNGMNTNAIFWSATWNNINLAWYELFYLGNSGKLKISYNGLKSLGYSVRCLKD